MRPNLNLSLPVTPAAVADAMALVASPDLAARLPESIRRMAWMVAANHAGYRIVQRQHLPRLGLTPASRGLAQDEGHRPSGAGPEDGAC